MNLPTDISSAVLIQLAAGACGLVATWAVVRYQIRQHAERIADLTRRYETIAQDLVNFRLEASQRFVSAETLDRVEERISASLKGVSDRFDKMTARLDAVLDSRTTGRRSS